MCKPILVLSFGQDLSWAGKLGQAEQKRENTHRNSGHEHSYHLTAWIVTDYNANHWCQFTSLYCIEWQKLYQEDFEKFDENQYTLIIDQG